MIQWVTIFLLKSFTLPQQTNADEIVKVSAPNVIIQAGKHSVINVAIEVKDGYHIQSHEVKNEFIIPTTLEINGGKEFIIKKQVYPLAKKFKLEGTDTYLDVYDGRFEIRIFFTTRKKVQRDKYRLHSKLNYQACDSVRCLFPRTVEFSIDVDVQ